MRAHSLSCLTICLSLCCLHSSTWLSAQELPVGIASKYPGDKNMDQHPSVIFTENFGHKSLDVLSERWEMIRDVEVMSLSSDVPQSSSGKQSLLMSQTAEKGTGGDLYRRLDDGYEKNLYLAGCT